MLREFSAILKPSHSGTKEIQMPIVCKKEIARYLDLRTSAIMTKSSREQQRHSIQAQILWAVISVSAFIHSEEMK